MLIDRLQNAGYHTKKTGWRLEVRGTKGDAEGFYEGYM